MMRMPSAGVCRMLADHRKSSGGSFMGTLLRSMYLKITASRQKRRLLKAAQTLRAQVYPMDISDIISPMLLEQPNTQVQGASLGGHGQAQGVTHHSPQRLHLAEALRTFLVTSKQPLRLHNVFINDKRWYNIIFFYNKATGYMSCKTSTCLPSSGLNIVLNVILNGT